MATYTREELVRSALLEIGALDANEAPDAADGQLADERAQQVLEELHEEGLIPFDVDTDTIPARYFRPVLAIVADALTTPFGRPGSEELFARAERGRKRLWQFRQKPYIPTPTRATYF